MYIPVVNPSLSPQQIIQQMEGHLIGFSAANYLLAWATTTKESMKSTTGKECLASRIKVWSAKAHKIQTSMERLIETADKTGMSLEERLRCGALNSFRFQVNLWLQGISPFYPDDSTASPPLESDKKSDLSSMKKVLDSPMKKAISTINQIFTLSLKNSISVCIILHPDATPKEMTAAQQALENTSTFLSTNPLTQPSDPKPDEGDWTPEHDLIEANCSSLDAEQTADALKIYSSIHDKVKALVQFKTFPGLELSKATLESAIQTKNKTTKTSENPFPDFSMLRV